MNEHVHKYIRVLIPRQGFKKASILKCALDGCTHFLSVLELAVGRRSICWSCGDEFFLRRYHVFSKAGAVNSAKYTRSGLAEAKPRCDSCREKRRERIMEEREKSA